MDWDWCGDLSNRFAEAQPSTPVTARFGPSKSRSNARPWSLHRAYATLRAMAATIEHSPRWPKSGSHENHAAAAQL
jgi:hypothetical protein